MLARQRPSKPVPSSSPTPAPTTPVPAAVIATVSPSASAATSTVSWRSDECLPNPYSIAHAPASSAPTPVFRSRPSGSRLSSSVTPTTLLPPLFAPPPPPQPRSLTRPSFHPPVTVAMTGRPPNKRSADGLEDDTPGVGKMKLPRADRGSEDFSTMVKERQQSHTRTGQACDRCKVRKIRCDGHPDGCSQCANSSQKCYVTDRSTGRTERRGYMSELERDKENMKTHIRDLERLLSLKGVEVRPWTESSWSNQAPDDVFDSMGNAIGWTQVGSVWTRNRSAANNHSFTRSFPRSQLESRPEESHLGVGHDSAPLSSIRGTRLVILGKTIDTASFEAPDVDEPSPGSRDPVPLYNKSVQSFLQSMMGVNPARRVELPLRATAFTQVDWYFKTVAPFVPLLHEPTFRELAKNVYDDPDFVPSVPELVIVHTIIAIMSFQWGVRNLHNKEERKRQNDLSNEHYHFALTKIYDLLTCPDLIAVQALALIASHTRAFPKSGCGGIVANIAFQRAIELNLHRAPKIPAEGTNLNIELRKRTWWAILANSMAITGRQGRPMPITVEEFDTPFPEPIADELLSEHGVDTSRTLPCPYVPGIVGFKIVPIFLEVYSNIYSVRRDRQNYANVVHALEQQLDRWERDLPDFLKEKPAQAVAPESAMPGFVVRNYGLELRLCLRHPSMAMTTDSKMRADNTRICEEVAGKMLHNTSELLGMKALDTTWYQMSVYVVATFSMLVAHWERRFSTTLDQVAVLRGKMERWMQILTETSLLLDAGPTIISTIRTLINDTLASIERGMPYKSGRLAHPQPRSEQPLPQPGRGLPQSGPLIKEELPFQPKPVALGGSSNETRNGYYQDPTLEPAHYTTMAYGDQSQGNISHPPYNPEPMYYNPPPAATVGVGPPNRAPSQANELSAFASQATRHMEAPADIWNGESGWQQWLGTMGPHEQIGANALLTMGGSTRDPQSSALMLPDNSLGQVDLIAPAQGAQWPFALFPGAMPQ